jgi:hypothetical protein
VGGQRKVPTRRSTCANVSKRIELSRTGLSTAVAWMTTPY